MITTWDLEVNVTGPLVEGGLRAWPASIQDRIDAEIEKQCKVPEGYKTEVTHSQCDYDPEANGWYVTLVVIARPIILRSDLH
jgi:hypothetical protein